MQKAIGWALLVAALVITMLRNGGAIPGGTVYVIAVSVLGFLGVEKLGWWGKLTGRDEPPSPCPACGVTNKPKATQCLFCRVPLGSPPTNEETSQ